MSDNKYAALAKELIELIQQALYAENESARHIVISKLYVKLMTSKEDILAALDLASKPRITVEHCLKCDSLLEMLEKLDAIKAQQQEAGNVPQEVSDHRGGQRYMIERMLRVLNGESEEL